MKVVELANQRYATKRFDSSKQIPREHIENLKEVLRLAPSSINIQPWQFTFVENPELKAELAKVSLHNEEKIKQANLLVVFSVADDLNEFQKVVESSLSQGLVDWYNSIRKTLPESELKNWFAKQVYIALGVGLSACVAMGLDSTPMEGIEGDKYQEILNHKSYKPILALAVGYHSEEDRNRVEVTPKSRRAAEDVIISL